MPLVCGGFLCFPTNILWGDKLQLYSNKEQTIGPFFATPDVGVYEDIKMQLEAQIPQGLKEKVDRELQPDERILWMDIPIPTFFTPESTKIFIFDIFFTSFAVFWTFGAAGFAIPNLEEVSNPFQFISILFPLFGLPFILIGLFLLLNPLFCIRQGTQDRLFDNRSKSDDLRNWVVKDGSFLSTVQIAGRLSEGKRRWHGGCHHLIRKLD